MVCIASFHWLAVRHGAWEELNGAQWEGGRKKAEQSYDDRTAPHRRSTSSISGIAGGRLVADGPWLRLLAANCDIGSSSDGCETWCSAIGNYSRQYYDGCLPPCMSASWAVQVLCCAASSSP
jgi:hypothetical protein